MWYKHKTDLCICISMSPASVYIALFFSWWQWWFWVTHLWHSEQSIPLLHKTIFTLLYWVFALWVLGIKFNEIKSVVLNFEGCKFTAKPLATLYSNGSILKTETSCKYLGHINDNNLNDNQDIERRLRNIYGKSNVSFRTFSSCSYSVKRQFFMLYCGPMYTASLWCDFT